MDGCIVRRWNAKSKSKHTTKIKWKDVRSDNWTIRIMNGKIVESIGTSLNSKRIVFHPKKGVIRTKSRY